VVPQLVFVGSRAHGFLSGKVLVKGLTGPYGRGQKVVPGSAEGGPVFSVGPALKQIIQQGNRDQPKGGLDDVPQRDGGLVAYLAQKRIRRTRECPPSREKVASPSHSDAANCPNCITCL